MESSFTASLVTPSPSERTTSNVRRWLLARKQKRRRKEQRSSHNGKRRRALQEATTKDDALVTPEPQHVDPMNPSRDKKQHSLETSLGSASKPRVLFSTAENRHLTASVRFQLVKKDPWSSDSSQEPNSSSFNQRLQWTISVPETYKTLGGSKSEQSPRISKQQCLTPAHGCNNKKNDTQLHSTKIETDVTNSRPNSNPQEETGTKSREPTNMNRNSKPLESQSSKRPTMHSASPPPKQLPGDRSGTVATKGISQPICMTLTTQPSATTGEGKEERGDYPKDHQICSYQNQQAPIQVKALSCPLLLRDRNGSPSNENRSTLSCPPEQIDPQTFRSSLHTGKTHSARKDQNEHLLAYIQTKPSTESDTSSVLSLPTFDSWQETLSQPFFMTGEEESAGLQDQDTTSITQAMNLCFGTKHKNTCEKELKGRVPVRDLSLEQWKRIERETACPTGSEAASFRRAVAQLIVRKNEANQSSVSVWLPSLIEGSHLFMLDGKN